MIALFKRLLGLDAPGIVQLSPQQVQARIKSGALLLDVRTPLERQTLSIPGSRSLALDELSNKWETLPKDQEIVCQCASGRRSAQASAFLASKGFTVFNLSGGIAAWSAAGLPVKRR